MNVGTDIGSTGIPPVPLAGQQENTIPEYPRLLTWTEAYLSEQGFRRTRGLEGSPKSPAAISSSNPLPCVRTRPGVPGANKRFRQPNYAANASRPGAPVAASSLASASRQQGLTKRSVAALSLILLYDLSMKLDSRQAQMNRKPLISVIIIFLNAERFIAEAIESVFGQNYDDWELLLVDDGSSDVSSAIARRYTEQHPEKVYYFEHAGHENRGMSASRNLGIRHARGQYIALLDADDVWLPKKLEYQVEILSRYPEAGMVVGPIQWWYSWTGKPDDFARDFVAPFPPELQSDSLVQPPKLLISLLRQATVSATSSLLRREVVDFVGGYEEDFRGMFEDQAFAAKVYLTAPVFVAADCHYKWRKHPNSCCAVAVETAQYEHARFDFLRWLQRYLSQRQISHIELESYA